MYLCGYSEESHRSSSPSVVLRGSRGCREPLSTVPPNLLAALPELPPDVNYRFLGRDLVLHDTRANIISDEIPDAIRCVGR